MHWRRSHPGIVVAGCWNVDGLHPLVLWHCAQSVRLPWCVPWQVVHELPAEFRPLVWQRSHGKPACTPPRAIGCVKWLTHEDVVWQRVQVPRSAWGRVWHVSQPV